MEEASVVGVEEVVGGGFGGPCRGFRVWELGGIRVGGGPLGDPGGRGVAELRGGFCVGMGSVFGGGGGSERREGPQNVKLGFRLGVRIAEE